MWNVMPKKTTLCEQRVVEHDLRGGTSMTAGGNQWVQKCIQIY